MRRLYLWEKKLRIKIFSHLLFGKLFKAIMAPLGVLVSTEFKIMTDSPRADILIIKKKAGKWTPDQLKLIPDGIRDSKARYIILEFKYSQSLSDKTCQQALGYDYFFSESYQLQRNDLQTFIVCAKTPRIQILEDYGYSLSEKKGVYKSDIRAFNHFPILILNELPDSYHNALIKAFSSRKIEREKAARVLQDNNYLDIIPKAISNIIFDIFTYIFRQPMEVNDMKDMTEEQAAKLARFIDVFVNTNLSLQDLLSQYKAKDVISQFKPKDIISQFKPKDIISQFKPEDILSNLDNEQLNQLRQRLVMMS
jgi:hypothetical protein